MSDKEEAKPGQGEEKSAIEAGDKEEDGENGCPLSTVSSSSSSHSLSPGPSSPTPEAEEDKKEEEDKDASSQVDKDQPAETAEAGKMSDPPAPSEWPRGGQGTGRGRGMAMMTSTAASGNNESLRRPGGRPAAAISSSPTTAIEPLTGPLAEIESGLRSLSLEDEDDALDGAKVLAIKIKEACETTEKLTKVLHGLHMRSLESPQFASKTAFLFGCLSQMEVEGVKCRNIFLRRIQEGFASASSSSKDYRSERRNLIVLLCQVFRRVRVADGTTIKALAVPILDNLGKLLDGDDEDADGNNDDVSVAAVQLQVIGPELRLVQPARFASVVCKVRARLTDPASAARLSSTSLALLLVMLELAGSSDWSLMDDGETFYKERLRPDQRPAPMEVSKSPSTATVPPPPAAAAPAAVASAEEGSSNPKMLLKSASLPGSYPGSRVPRHLPKVVDTSRPPPPPPSHIQHGRRPPPSQHQPHHQYQGPPPPPPHQHSAAPPNRLRQQGSNGSGGGPSLFQAMPPCSPSASASSDLQQQHWGGTPSTAKTSWESSGNGGGGGGWGEPGGGGAGAGAIPWSTGEDDRGTSGWSTGGMGGGGGRGWDAGDEDRAAASNQFSGGGGGARSRGGEDVFSIGTWEQAPSTSASSSSRKKESSSEGGGWGSSEGGGESSW